MAPAHHCCQIVQGGFRPVGQHLHKPRGISLAMMQVQVAMLECSCIIVINISQQAFLRQMMQPGSTLLRLQHT